MIGLDMKQKSHLTIRCPHMGQRKLWSIYLAEKKAITFKRLS